MNETSAVRFDLLKSLVPTMESLPVRYRRAAHPDAFVRLFFAIEALRNVEDGCIVVQFIAPHSGAGVSTIAAGYARVAAAERSKPVLTIDCSPTDRRVSDQNGGADNAVHDAPSLSERSMSGHYLGEGGSPRFLIPADGIDNLVTARLSPEIHPLLDIGSSRIGPLLTVLRRDFSVIVLDCPAATHADAAALARHADGTVLVADAGVSRSDQLVETRDDLERLGGQVIGTVFNRHRRVLPRWLSWLP